MMLETFTVDTFAPHIGETFEIVGGTEQRLKLELVAATSLGRQTNRAAQQREQFSIHFRGPAGVVLPQQIYTLEFEPIGTFDIFLVPIGNDATGTRYEAIFT
jgi:hypothetical protein